MSAQPRRARSPEAKAARRKALLDAALDVFFEQGFAAARMETIARSAGVSKGTAYLYFDSKEALFRAIVEEVALPRIQALEKAAEVPLPLAEHLPSMMKLAANFVQYSPMPRIAKVLIGEGGQFPELLRFYHEKVIARGLGVLTRLLEAARARGEIRVEDPALTARWVIAPVLFSALWQVTFARHAAAELDVEAFLAQHARLALRALSQNSQPVSGA